MCGESVPVGAQRPAKITAVDVATAPQRGGGWFISVPWLKRVHLTAAVTVGGTTESKHEDRRVYGVSPVPACLVSKREAGGKLEPVVSHLLQGESLWSLGF